MDRDRFGNLHAPGMPYARGQILTSTADDLAKLRRAWDLMRERRETLGPDSLFQLSGLDRTLHIEGLDGNVLDDEICAALYSDDVTRLGLEHLGGDPAEHDVMLLNRLTAALLVAADVLIEPGETVIGVSPSYSHPAVRRAVAHAKAELQDAKGLTAFRAAMAAAPKVSTVFLTRLAVSYEILEESDLREIVGLAREAGARVIVDDAGGARVGPAVFGQPRMLELGVDIVATGLDKYGTSGPRLGLLAGDRDVVAKIRTRAYEMGTEARQMLYPAVVESLENYRPERVRDLVASTKSFAQALKQRLGDDHLFETPVTIQLKAEDILELAMARAGLHEAPVVPIEATACLAMLLLRDHGVLTVHFAGIPPGTSALMFKFLPPDTLERFGGPGQLAEAVDDSLTKLADLLHDQTRIRTLLLGSDDTPSV